MPPTAETLRQASALTYLGPRKATTLAIMCEVSAQASGMLERYWRNRANRHRLTIRQAAMFCAGRKAAEPGREWSFVQWPEENSPIDIVLRATKAGEDTIYEFVQLKELVPEEVAAGQSMQSVLDRLGSRYGEIGGITVAILVNRTVTTNLAALTLPSLPGASLWLFGQEAGGGYFLCGDLLRQPTMQTFSFRGHPDSPARWGGNLLD
jgi:hypothetical protein